MRMRPTKLSKGIGRAVLVWAEVLVRGRSELGETKGRRPQYPCTKGRVQPTREGLAG